MRAEPMSVWSAYDTLRRLCRHAVAAKSGCKRADCGFCKEQAERLARLEPARLRADLASYAGCRESDISLPHAARAATPRRDDGNASDRSDRSDRSRRSDRSADGARAAAKSPAAKGAASPAKKGP